MEIPTSDIDHYAFLGLPSGEDGAKLTLSEISKAYKQKALILHPDKNLNNPNAAANFQQLKSSFEILKNESSRKIYDDLLKLRRDTAVRDRQLNAKRRRMVSDLEEREKSAFYGVDPEREARVEEERIKKKLADEIRRIREKLAKAKGGREEVEEVRRENVGGGGGGVGLEKGKVLKVSWEKNGFGEYTAARLKEVFEEVGVVEDVVIRSGKKKGSALVVMGSKEDVDAATGVVLGDLSNPLLVLPLEQTNSIPGVRAQEPVATMDETPLGNVVGAGHQAFENSVMEKLRKAAQKQK